MDLITLSTLLNGTLTMPSGLWESIIGAVYGWIGDYGFTIFLIAIVLKLIMFPLDYFQRKSSMVNMAQQKSLAPQLQKLKEKCGDDKNLYNQKQIELYKKEGVSLFGSCGVMIVYMAVTLLLFVTFFSSMGNIANSVTVQQYQQIQVAYESVEAQGETESSEEYNARIEIAVLDAYDNCNISWLWVQNIWRSDTIISPVASFETYESTAKLDLTDEELVQAETEYDNIMNIVKENIRSNNGYYVLIVLVGVISYFSAKFSMKVSLKRKEKSEKVEKGRILSAKGDVENPQTLDTNKMMGVMQYVLPILMVVIAFSYNAAFAIYMVATSLGALISNVIINRIIGDIDVDELKKKKKELTTKKVVLPDYARRM